MDPINLRAAAQAFDQAPAVPPSPPCVESAVFAEKQEPESGASKTLGDGVLGSEAPVENGSVTTDNEEPSNGPSQGCPISPDFLPSLPPVTTNQLKFIEKNIFKSLWNLNIARPFHYPVDSVALNIPDYYQLVRFPMDMTTIKKRLVNGWYRKAEECVQDFNLMFSNCFLYNGVHTTVYQAAQRLEEELRLRLLGLPVPEMQTEFRMEGIAEEEKKANKSKKKKKRSPRKEGQFNYGHCQLCRPDNGRALGVN